MKKNQLLFCVFCLISAAFIVCGCSEVNKTTEAEATPEDSLAAIVKVQQANTALENVMMNWNDNPQQPSDIDFTPPYDLYGEALELDPANLHANFGIGFCSLMMITVDPQINQAWNTWKTFLDTAEFFGHHDVIEFDSSNSYVPPLPTFPSMQNFNSAPIAMIPTAFWGMATMATDNLPMFSDIQNILETELIPRLEQAYASLEVVDNNLDYTFTITPKMQGDLNEDPLELDMTEVYAMETALKAAEAFSRILISYNVNFNSYDSLGLVQAFTLGANNSFLKLKSSGDQNLAMAKSSLMTALNKAQAGIDFLGKETDWQGDDIIFTNLGDSTDLDSISKYIEYAQTAINGNWTWTDDWDDNWMTPDQSVTFHVASFFDNPIQDFKAQIPAYTVRVERDTDNYRWNDYSDQDTITTTVDFPSSGSYSWEWYYSWGSGWENSWGDTSFTIPAFSQAFNAAVNQLKSVPYVHYVHVYMSWDGNFDAGTHTISGYLQKWWETETPDFGWNVYLYWTETDYDQWNFPNSTFNGILPGMTSPQFKLTFGITEEEWEPYVHMRF